MNEKNLNNATPAKAVTTDPKAGNHPVGVGVGAVSAGAAAGAVGGVLGGPVGVVAGAAIGAVAGGLAGKATAEAINPTVETKFWMDNHAAGPLARTAFGYEAYAPAYRYGWESFGRRTAGQTFANAEADLGRGWDKAKGESKLAWDDARSAARNAWDRVELAARRPAVTTAN